MSLWRRILGIVLLLGVLQACSGISVLNGVKKEDLYNKQFLQKIGAIKEKYRSGKVDEALKSLRGIDEKNLLPTEKALRRTLIGVIHFSKKNFEQAIYNFDIALGSSRLDKSLTAQIFLNLSSSYYKLGHHEKAITYLKQSDWTELQSHEADKHFLLGIRLARELGQDDYLVKSMIYLLGGKGQLSEIKSNPYFDQLLSKFSQMGRNEKMRLIEDFDDNHFLVVGYLAYIEVEKLYYNSQKEEAKDLLYWIENRYADHPDIMDLVKGFRFRIENYAQMDPGSIGIVLPLSGKKEGFGQRTLLGIDSALNSVRSVADDSSRFKAFIKDSEGSGVVGAHRVKELIEKHQVSAIIGGLFSDEASKEYLEARRHGVFFISLSQVYLPKEQKDHLLLEIPGSIESQINLLFSKKLLDHFGKKGAIIFPDSQRGEAYVEEFWRKAGLKNVRVTGALSYDKNKTDYRDPVKNILGLKFPRERKEEYTLLEEIHELEDQHSMRRVQTLKPQVDFDWVFIPAFPREALQLIPSFNYYDAFNLNLIGGPSWRSQSLSKHSHKLGNLFLIGEAIGDKEKAFAENFVNKYHRKPRLLEMYGHDAFEIINGLLGEKEFSSRDELDIYIRSKEKLVGVSGNWKMADGIWIKEMHPLQLKRGAIEKVFDENGSLQ